MSMYRDSDSDEVFYLMNEFLESHKLSELLRLVKDVVEQYEEKDDDGI